MSYESDLAGHVSGYLADILAGRLGVFRLGGEAFRAGSLEDAESLGWDADDPVLLIRRESDGALFEVTVDVDARRALPEPPHDENHYRYHTPNQPLADCASCIWLGWAR